MWLLGQRWKKWCSFWLNSPIKNLFANSWQRIRRDIFLMLVKLKENTSNRVHYWEGFCLILVGRRITQISGSKGYKTYLSLDQEELLSSTLRQSLKNSISILTLLLRWLKSSAKIKLWKHRFLSGLKQPLLQIKSILRQCLSLSWFQHQGSW